MTDTKRVGDMIGELRGLRLLNGACSIIHPLPDQIFDVTNRAADLLMELQIKVRDLERERDGPRKQSIFRAWLVGRRRATRRSRESGFGWAMIEHYIRGAEPVRIEARLDGCEPIAFDLGALEALRIIKRTASQPPDAPLS